MWVLSSCPNLTAKSWFIFCFLPRIQICCINHIRILHRACLFFIFHELNSLFFLSSEHKGSWCYPFVLWNDRQVFLVDYCDLYMFLFYVAVFNCSSLCHHYINECDGSLFQHCQKMWVFEYNGVFSLVGGWVLLGDLWRWNSHAKRA